MSIPVIVKIAIPKDDKKLIAAASQIQNTENKQLAQALGIPIRYRLLASASMVPETIVSDDGKLVTRAKEIVMPRYLLGKGVINKGLDSVSLRHELAEAEALLKGNMRPIHSHADPSVLHAEYSALRRFPRSFSDKWFDDMRLEDIKANITYHSPNAKELDDHNDVEQYPLFEKLLLQSAAKDKLPLKQKDLIDAYDASRGESRSSVYRAYIDGMVDRASGKAKEDDKDNAYNMFNNYLIPSLRKDLAAEENTAKDIVAKSKKAIIPNTIIGALLGAAMAYPFAQYATTGKDMLKGFSAGAIPGALLGGYGGMLMRRDKEIDKAYFPEDKAVGKTASNNPQDPEEPSQTMHSHSPAQLLRPRAEAIIYDKDGVLGIKKQDYLLFPGGGIADGETPMGSVIRESLEEASAVLKNIEEVDVVQTTYDKDNIISEGWDGETTHFFLALYGGDAKTNHPDKEDFKFIPFDECAAFIQTLLDDPKQMWAAENNRIRLRYVTQAKELVGNPVTFILRKYAAEMREYRKGNSYSSSINTFKYAAESSAFRDFMAGVEPTGKYTFESAMNNKHNHWGHRTIGNIGGFIGGSTIVPAVIGATALGIPRYIGAGSSRSSKIILDSAIKPYKMLYNGARASRELSSLYKGTGNSTKHIVKSIKDTTVGEASKILGAGKGTKFYNNISKDMGINSGKILRNNPDLYKSLRKNINYSLYGGGGMIALSGATNALSANAQYSSGLKAQNLVNK